MENYTFTTLLQCLTVDSADDGHHFVRTARQDAITHLLSGSLYHVVAQGDLFTLYGKQPLAHQDIVLVSSHIDTVYSACFCQTDAHELYHGTFDNSLTNAAVIYNMLHHPLPDNVYIAFTGDEEKDSRGCRQLIEYIGQMCEQVHCSVRFALVTDVSNEGWASGASFSIENDLSIDLFTAARIVHTLQPYLYSYVHEAEPDESWDYDEYHIPTLTYCVPVHGDMHSDSGVCARKHTITEYCQVMRLLLACVSA